MPPPPEPTSLGTDVYVAPERHRLECQRVFRRAWLPVVRARELDAPGSFVATTVDRSPLAVVRGADGTLSAFHNVCRHRGAQVLRGERGCVREVRCPYHDLVYALDGTLRSLPKVGTFPASFRPGAVRLPPVAVDELAGWVWIHLGEPRSRIADDLGPMTAELARWPLATLDVKTRRAFEVEFDWKIGVEAFVESLHVPFVHGRSLYPFVDIARTRWQAFGDHSGMHVPFRLPSAHEPDGLLGAAAYRAGVEAFAGLDEEQRTHHYAYLIFPSTILLVSPNDAMLLSMLPLAAGRAHVRVEVLGSPATAAAQAAYYASLEPAYDRLLLEDLRNLPWIQRGLAGGSLAALTIGALEERIAHFRRTLETRLATGVD